MQTVLLKITGMTCGGCVNSVTHVLKAISGIDDVKVSLPTGEASVQYNEKVTSPDQMVSAIKAAGYGVEPY